MKKFITLFVLFCLPFSASALVRISAAKPFMTTFSGAPNGIYSLNQGSTTQASGYVVSLSLPGFPNLGYEEYVITHKDSTYSEEFNSISTNMVDIFLIFEPPFTIVTVGYGRGTILFTCESASCAGLEFKEGEATQYYMEIGVELWPLSDLSFGFHRIIGGNPIVGTTQVLDLSNRMLTVGLGVGF